MSEHEKLSLLDRFIQAFIRKTFDNVLESIEHYTRRLVRTFAVILGGIAIALLGVAAVTVGITKWLTLFMPSWLAWLFMGIMLLLVGALLVAVNK